MENSSSTLIDLFSLSYFSIPPYQRAYSWLEDHYSAFLNDLRQQVSAIKANPEKSYFLGTLLLHQRSLKNVDIVDGQQRLTTSVIFIAAALRRELDLGQHNFPKKIKRAFIYDDDEDRQKFKTMYEDHNFFRSYVLGIDAVDLHVSSPSSSRLKAAYDFFNREVDDSEWSDLLNVLINSKVMIYSVLTEADATLIFELQNDRGKKLTDLESLKSYLMHLIYLNSANPEDELKAIQQNFEHIYRDVEKLGSNKKTPDEDSILAYHAVADLEWAADEWRKPKALVKEIIASKSAAEIRKWILNFTAELQNTYKTFNKLFCSLDEYSELAELLIFDRMASFWPLVIKCYKLDKSEMKTEFRLALRLMEVYAVRGYGLGNLRSDAGLSSLYTAARDFNGKFTELHTLLHSMSDWYDLESRSREGIDRAGLYRSNRKEAQYILWRYENYLRSQAGKRNAPLSWKDYLEPKDGSVKLSIEHIAAQHNPISETLVEWGAGEGELRFADVATHRLGNLVIDSISANASKGKKDFSGKLESLTTESVFLSQGELIKYAVPQNGEPSWTVDSIKIRHENIKQFYCKTWSPNSYFTPNSDPVAEEQS